MKKISDYIFLPFRRWISITDIYVIKKFFVSTVFAHIIIISIAIVIDLSEKTEKFVERSAPTMEIVQYYLDFIPFITSILAPLLIFLAVIFLLPAWRITAKLLPCLTVE